MPQRRKVEEPPDLKHLLHLCLRHRDPHCQEVLERLMRALDLDARYRLRLRAMLENYTRRYFHCSPDDPRPPPEEKKDGHTS